MKKELKIKMEVNIKKIIIDVSPRYLEDSSFNGMDDNENGDLVKKFQPNIVKLVSDEKPYFGDNDGKIYLHFEIDADTGQILNWSSGTKASLSYKSVDINSYYVFDENNGLIVKAEYTYVLGNSCINEYGDYFCPNINENGMIENWNNDCVHDIVDSINSDNND